MQVFDHPLPRPSEAVLALHNSHRRYASFAAFQPDLADLLHQGALLDDCVALTRELGFLEPLTDRHLPPEAIAIQGPNYRESLLADGLLSRNRAVLWLLEHLYGSLGALQNQQVYLVEALSGFAQWLSGRLGTDRLLCSEYLEDAERSFSDVPHQDLSALTLDDRSLDLVLCNELFEHVRELQRAFSEIARVLRPGGRLVATCPLAFGQYESIIKAESDPHTGAIRTIGDPEFHGDPIRPEAGALVYRIPGWDVLEQLRTAGFSDVAIHHITSWKHGVLGSDLPGVLVIAAQR